MPDLLHRSWVSAGYWLTGAIWWGVWRVWAMFADLPNPEPMNQLFQEVPQAFWDSFLLSHISSIAMIASFQASYPTGNCQSLPKIWSMILGLTILSNCFTMNVSVQLYCAMLTQILNQVKKSAAFSPALCWILLNSSYALSTWALSKNWWLSACLKNDQLKPHISQFLS